MLYTVPMVNNAQDIHSLLQNNSKQFRQYGVVKLGLFGSFASNQANTKSDVDLLVEFAGGQKTFKNYMATANFTEQLLGRPVDLVTKESLSPHIGPHILKEVQYVQIT